MNKSSDNPKSLHSHDMKQARLAQISEPHIAPLTEFVEIIRKESGLDSEIPYFDPLDGGIHAKCLFLFEAPGSKAVESCFISRNNPDESAKNFFVLNKQAGLTRELTVSWNVVPWYIGTGGRIRPAKQYDIGNGEKYLFRLLPLLPHLKIIALCGRKAQRAERLLEEYSSAIAIVTMPHPSAKSLNINPEYRVQILHALQNIKTHLFPEADKWHYQDN